MADPAKGGMNVVRLFGSGETECGYCKGERSSVVDKTRDTSSRAYTIVAEKLQVALYEDFLRRGWRRSGVALYKPDNWNSCCPAITIRLPVDKFSPTKSQKRLLKRMESLLNPNIPINAANPNPQNPRGKKPADVRWSKIQEHLRESGILDHIREVTSSALIDLLSKHAFLSASLPVVSFKLLPPHQKRKPAKSEGDGSEDVEEEYTSVTLMSSVCAAVAGRSKGSIDAGVLSQQMVDVLIPKLVTGSPVHPKLNNDKIDYQDQDNQKLDHKRHRSDSDLFASVQRIERHEASGQIFLHLHVKNTLDKPPSEKSKDASFASDIHSNTTANPLAAWWQNSLQKSSLDQVKPPYQLTMTTMPAHESALDPAVHQLYWRYQNKIHGDADPFVDESDTSHEYHEFAVRAPSGWKEKAEAMLHNEYKHLPESRRKHLTTSYMAFYDFLVDNPFGASDVQNGPRLGAYHQQYRIANGLLIAVGVIDILPSGLSSVYLYYDPSFAEELVPLGKYSILREIQWTLEAKLPYYYLGYYIESCPKMRYKADYHPSELLCPTTYTWVDAQEAQEILKTKSPVRHCCTLASSSSNNNSLQQQATQDNENVESFLSRIRMEVGHGGAITLDMLTPEGQDFVAPLLRDFAAAAGSRIATQCTIDFRQG